MMNVDGTNVLPIIDDFIFLGPPVLSPDAKRIAFTGRLLGQRDRNQYEIFVVNADGTDLRQLTENNVEDSFPTWSPDGNSIAFMSYRDGASKIFVMNTQDGEVRQLTDFSPARAPKWSPDGNKIAFVGFVDNSSGDPEVAGSGQYEIFVVNTDGTNIHRLTNNADDDYLAISKAWSPDSEQILYLTRARSEHQTWLVS